MNTAHIRPLDEHICFSAYTTVHAIQRLYQPTLAEHHLTYPQYLVLVALYADPPKAVPVKKLSAQLDLSTGTLTPILKRMTKAGLIARQRSPHDDRSVLITLTEAGVTTRKVLNTLPNILTERGGLDEAEWQQLQTLMNKLMRNLTDQ